MTRPPPRLMALLLCATALAGCATTPDIARATGGRTAADSDKAQMAGLGKTPGDLESSIHQAQLLRISGRYDEAIKILSQLMLVASDDPRVLGEYGKTLTEEGRASEAVQFLSRATELQPNDWTLYSATGVALDQLGNQPSARLAYERALTLKPGEASVLSNYALSRMLANDPDGAHKLVARAEVSGGAADPKIARNIAMVNALTPMADVPAAPVAMSHPATMPQQASSTPHTNMPANAPHAPVTTQPLAAIAHPSAQTAPVNGVVMQPVPIDPLAGPVQGSANAGPVKPATHAPRPLTSPGLASAAKPEAARPEAAKPVIASVTPPKPAETAKADIKPAPAKPAEVKAADAKTNVKTDTKPTVVNTASAKIDIKPEMAKVADAKPAPAKPAAPSAKPDTVKNAVPALRMAADNKY